MKFILVCFIFNSLWPTLPCRPSAGLVHLTTTGVEATDVQEASQPDVSNGNDSLPITGTKGPGPNFEKMISILDGNFSQCLRTGGALNLSGLAGQIHFGPNRIQEHVHGNLKSDHRSNVTKEAESANHTGHTNFHDGLENVECVTRISVPADEIVKLSLDFCSNLDLLVYEFINGNTRHRTESMTQNKTVYHSQKKVEDVAENNWLWDSEKQTDKEGTEDGTGSAMDRTVVSVACGSQSPASDVFSQSHTVWVVVRPTQNQSWAELALHLRFAAVKAAEHGLMQLQVIRISPSEVVTFFSGFAPTPGWDGQRQFSVVRRSCITVTSPPGHTIFLSFQVMAIYGSCQEDNVQQEDEGEVYVALLAGACRYTVPRLWKHCSTHRPTPALYSPSILSLYFVTDKVIDSTGFRARFSFHNQTARPRQLQNGQWNCSVHFWTDFRQHLLCDLMVQCEKGEDEVPCEYTSQHCGVGNLAIEGRCYIYMRPSSPISWEAAFDSCADHGAQLASLGTPREWNSVIRLLNQSDFRLIHVGLKTTALSAPNMYWNTWQWLTGHIAYHLDIGGSGSIPLCAVIMSLKYKCEVPRNRRQYKDHVLRSVYCNRPAKAFYLCEMPGDSSETSTIAGKTSPILNITAARPSPSVLSTSSTSGIEFLTSRPLFKVITCPEGHRTHTFLACDKDSACWASGSFSTRSGTCSAPLKPLPPNFQCANAEAKVPYSLLCDYRSDCRDSSDENFCDFQPCLGDKPVKCGNSGQCFTYGQICDGDTHCATGDDEKLCNYKRVVYIKVQNPPPPATVVFDFTGSIAVRNWTGPGCPDNLFQCPDEGYCMPVYVRCNDVKDCPGGEDEMSCDQYICPGFYRCRSSKICVSVDVLCDGVYHCPRHDDETMCEGLCPQHCVCYGLAFYCFHVFYAKNFSSLRFLEARGSGLSFADLINNTMLVHLGLAACQLKHVFRIGMFLLHSLDLSDNHLQSLSMRSLQDLSHLRSLDLAGNPLADLLGDHDLIFASLHTMDVSRTLLNATTIKVVSRLTRLHFLNLSHSRIDKLRGLESLTNLRVLDLSGCEVDKVPSDILRSMRLLEELHTDNPKLCCAVMLPTGFNLNHCLAPLDSLSSCDALLKSDVYRIALSIFAVLALLGNVISFVYRLCLPSSTKKLGFHVFVTQLCVSDFLMGVYLAVIGVADRVFEGNYLWKDYVWKNSLACQAAGFLSLLSSETSALAVCLITLERFLVICFPFSSFHFKGRSAYITSALLWMAGLVLAAFPLLPGMSHWRFYSHTGICIPLPITKFDFAGHRYSFGVMIVLNLVLFCLIVVGQGLIYWSVRLHSLSILDTNSKVKDAVIARRLLTVVLSDFMCWFPIGLCGLLASVGFSIPGEVNIALAILVLPVNAALNPFLYTLNVILEKRQRRHEERIKRFLLCANKSNESHK